MKSRALVDVTRALADATRALADVTRALADVTRAPTLFEQSEPRRKDTRLRQTGSRIIAQSKLSAAALARANGTPSCNQTTACISYNSDQSRVDATELTGYGTLRMLR